MDDKRIEAEFTFHFTKRTNGGTIIGFENMYLGADDIEGIMEIVNGVINERTKSPDFNLDSLYVKILPMPRK